METKYDSTADTVDHINKVRHYMSLAVLELNNRSLRHDRSKLDQPEKSVFDEWTPKLASSTYGSPEYKEMLAAIKPALDHHYAHNSHHPEHFQNGIDGMNIFDVLEMLCDWIAATQRHNNGDIVHSIHINADRFGMSRQLQNIFFNTLIDLQLVEEVPQHIASGKTVFYTDGKYYITKKPFPNVKAGQTADQPKSADSPGRKED